MVNIHAAIRELPGVFKAVSEQRDEYDRVLRAARLAEGPLTLVAPQDSLPAARAAALALEMFLEWPARARECHQFLQYSLASARPRSTLVAISETGEDENITAAAATAIRQGVKTLAVTCNHESALARVASAVLPLPAREAKTLAGRLAARAALLEIAAAAARIFNPRSRLLNGIDFDVLPGLIENMNVQLEDPIRAMAAQARGFQRLTIVGGGFYEPTAAEAAAVERNLAHTLVDAGAPDAAHAGAGECAIVLSGSQCRLKKQIHAAASRLASSGARVLAITDSNDRPLIAASHFAVLIPEIPEVAGSLLAQIVLERFFLESSHLPEQPV